MFRRFFQRDKQDGQKLEPQELEQTPGATQPDESASNQLKQTTELLHQQAGQQEEDDVHRMVLRAGDQKLPEDLAEQAYGAEQGEHAAIARQDMHINIEFDLICRDLWPLYPADVMWPLEQATIFGLIFVGDYSDAARAYKKAYFERINKQQ